MTRLFIIRGARVDGSSSADSGGSEGSEGSAPYEPSSSTYEPSSSSSSSAAADSQRRRRRPAGKNKRPRAPEEANVAWGAYTRDERAFFRAASGADKRRICALEGAAREWDAERAVPLRFRVLLSGLDDVTRGVALRKVEQLRGMHESSNEYHKLAGWVSAVCALPAGRLAQLPVRFGAPAAQIGAFLAGVRARLDSAVYGHEPAKNQIVRLLGQWIANPGSKGMAIGVQGPMGCGKTSLVKEGVCAALGLPFAFVPLGGASDGCYLDGHSYTYEGATWGKIADLLMKCRCMNPVLFFDELDKVSETYKGQEVTNLLIHLTDASQNDKFADKYFADVPLDLSRCLMIFSYNDESRIHPVLRDRLVRIHATGYSTKQKVEIATRHLLPAILADFGLAPGDVTVAEPELAHIIATIEEERGVRNLRRMLHDMVSTVNLKRLVDAALTATAPAAVGGGAPAAQGVDAPPTEARGPAAAPRRNPRRRSTATRNPHGDAASATDVAADAAHPPTGMLMSEASKRAIESALTHARTVDTARLPIRLTRTDVDALLGLWTRPEDAAAARERVAHMYT